MCEVQTDMNPAPVISASPIHALEAARNPPRGRLGVGPRPPIQKSCQNNPQRESLSAFSNRNRCENLRGNQIFLHANHAIGLHTKTHRNSQAALLGNVLLANIACYCISNIFESHITPTLEVVESPPPRNNKFIHMGVVVVPNHQQLIS